MTTKRKNTAPEDTVPEPDTDAAPTENATGDESPAAEAEPTEDKPTPRSLEWWKAKAREHQTTIDTLTAERDALQARLDTVQQREAEALVTGKLHDPADLFRFGPPLAELLDEDGNVSAELVDAALAAVVAEHPHLSVRHGISPAAPASMVTSRDVPDREAKQPRTFQELLRGAGRTG
ncbi:hypothetical protein H7I53_23070 [Mycolicibacterium pulveris]|uniref:Scaffolding protein n=1 Tax=Mycolicibacterium pulveris TaxID=36813 RepID=A0A7I7UQ35_MYCPV|nr:hypothetical protein [Mycolicibacterium pulveris]MCV6983089.1 hypothetical protein [Mycolicibacterium pulveris]BBY82953.1 hypothetical protein MPUL_41110 [Mycolicibacterium pulveris]